MPKKNITESDCKTLNERLDSTAPSPSSDNSSVPDVSTDSVLDAAADDDAPRPIDNNSPMDSQPSSIPSPIFAESYAPRAEQKYNEPFFPNDSRSLFPSAVRVRMWQEQVAPAKLQQLELAAQEAYRQALENHELVVLRIHAKNEIIAHENNELYLKYHTALVQFEEQLACFKRQWDPDRIQRALTENIIETVEGQRALICECLCQLSARRLRQNERKDILLRSAFHFDFTDDFLLGKPNITNTWSLPSPLLLKGGYRSETFAPHFDASQFPLKFYTKGHPLDAGREPYFESELRQMFGGNAPYVSRPKRLPTADEIVTALKNQVLTYWQLLLSLKNFAPYFAGEHLQPFPPSTPHYTPFLPFPSTPQYTPTVLPGPPQDCYDKLLPPRISDILQGTEFGDAEYNYQICRTHIFKDNIIRPFYDFGAMPVPFFEGQVAHILCLGQSGSGKTTMILLLMSSLLPLSRSQRQQILQDARRNNAPPTPRSHSEWSRSFTHQAVIYNAKQEYVPYLAAFGFDPDTDLVILDTDDERGKAWDLATDICDADSVSWFVEYLLPDAPEGMSDDNAKHWKEETRALVTAVIDSFRKGAKAADERPSWNLSDVINAFDSDDTLKDALRFSPKSKAWHERIFGVDERLKGSAFNSTRTALSRYEITAARWEYAASRGRLFSLKEWAMSGAHSVVVLPYTSKNPKVNTPLNQLYMQVFTHLFLDQRYTEYEDENGRIKVRKRYVFIDEMGEAGQFHQLERLMTQGRTFGVNVVLGLQQLSQPYLTYREHRTDTILGQCSYKMLLKVEDPKTQEWASKTVGEQRKKITKVSHTKGKAMDVTIGASSSQTDSDGTGSSTNSSESDTDSQNNSKSIASGSSSGPGGRSSHTTNQEGTTDSHSHTLQKGSGTSKQTSHAEQSGGNVSVRTGEQEGTTVQHDTQKDFLILPSEWGDLADPTTDEVIEVVHIVPFLLAWRTQTPFAMLQPEYQTPYEEARRTCPQFVPLADDDTASTLLPWDHEDYARLHIGGLPSNARRAALVRADMPLLSQHPTDCISPVLPRIPCQFDFEDE